MIRLSTLIVALVGAMPMAAPVAAQEDPAVISAFQGDWFSFEPEMWQGEGPCKVALSEAETALPGQRRAVVTACVSPLAEVINWRVSSGQIILISADGATVAALGGNQLRLTGDSAGGDMSFILERGSGDGRAAGISAAIRRHRCIYLGFASTCAAERDLAPPPVTGVVGELATIEVLVNLNIRSQPRGDAAVIGTIPRDSEILVDFCTRASDGIWCRARFGDTQGWMAKTALRRDEWPVVTYRSRAPEES